MIRSSRITVMALLLALSGCSQQDPASSWAVGTPSLQGLPVSAASPMAAARSVDAIANSPDRGELVRYDRLTAPLKQGAFTSYPVQVSEDHAIGGIVSGRLSIPAPDGQQLQLDYERHAESTDGNWTWVGRLAGGDQSREAIITFGEKAVFGLIPQGRGRPDLALTTRAGKLWMVETDPRLAPSIDRREQDTLVPSATARSQLASAASSGSQEPSSSTATATSSNTIDLLLGYTTGFAAQFGGQSQAVTRLTQLVAVNNQAYLNSQINGTVRLVGTRQVDYPDGGTNKAALTDLTGSDGSRATTVPASLLPLRAARDTLGADLVALVRAYEFVNEGCGIAWLLGAGQRAISPTQDAVFGYSIVSNLPDGTSVPGTDGKRYFCSSDTLAHELGHLMGSAHDIENSKTDGAVRFGRYAYSFGAKTGPTDGNYFTVMSYSDKDQTGYRVFSNPNITFCGGFPCGSSAADNARSLNQTIPVVAGFRATVVPIVPVVVLAARNDINADGKDDLLWHNSQQNRHGFWLMNGSTILQAPNFFAAPGFVIAAHGDFNGDGRLDVIWVSPQRELYVLTSTGNAFANGRYIGAFPVGWEIVSAGDVDGDGVSDLIWHNASARQYGYWIMGNGAPTLIRSFPAAAGYSLVASGYFDGDKYLDLIWGSAKGDLVMLKGNGATFTDSLIGNYPDAGRIFAAADVNGDGRDDLLLLNRVESTWGYWIMDGARVTEKRSFSANPAYFPVSVADFNGDGRADVLWSSSALDLQLLSGNGSTFTHARVGVYGDGWRPVDKRIKLTN